jgi:hypothetical protein
LAVSAKAQTSTAATIERCFISKSICRVQVKT